MAITWELIPIVISIENKTVSIVAVRLDSEDPTNPMMYKVSKAVLSTTPSENLWILDEIWNSHQTALTKNTQVTEFLSDLISLGKSNLEGRE